MIKCIKSIVRSVLNRVVLSVNIIVKLVFTPILIFCFKYKILHPQVIILMGGGICSQIRLFLLGTIYNDKGLKVTYDCSWFKKNGKDGNGIYARNYDFSKLFPNIKLSEPSCVIAYLYRLCFSRINDDCGNNFLYLDFGAPSYIYGYYKEEKTFYSERLRRFLKLNIGILNDENKIILDQIKSKNNPVAIHVRRGDLAVYYEAYGNPVSYSYFNHAISYLEDKYKDCYYFIFSDEPLWCKNSLMKYLPLEGSYDIIDINGSELGYFDLILMSSCKHIVATKGSLGKFAAMFKEDEGELILPNDTDLMSINWMDCFPNAIHFRT